MDLQEGTATARAFCASMEPWQVDCGLALPRQKRAGGTGKGPGARQEGKDRAGLADLAADLVGWAAGELPGEAGCLVPAADQQHLVVAEHDGDGDPQGLNPAH